MDLSAYIGQERAVRQQAISSEDTTIDQPSSSNEGVESGLKHSESNKSLKDFDTASLSSYRTDETPTDHSDIYKSII